jgi:hypothetical protein
MAPIIVERYSITKKYVCGMIVYTCRPTDEVKTQCIDMDLSNAWVIYFWNAWDTRSCTRYINGVKHGIEQYYNRNKELILSIKYYFGRVISE